MNKCQLLIALIYRSHQIKLRTSNYEFFSNRNCFSDVIEEKLTRDAKMDPEKMLQMRNLIEIKIPLILQPLEIILPFSIAVREHR